MAVLAALAMALVHLLSPRLDVLDGVPRSRWLSAAGGISTAYVFVHLLPELARHQEDGASGLAIYAAAMVLHFVVNDRGLYAHHGPRYLSTGRWVLAAAPFAGLGLAALSDLPEWALALALAFLGGGVILNVMKEELPEERRSRFSAFALGAAGYAALLFFFV